MIRNSPTAFVLLTALTLVTITACGGNENETNATSTPADGVGVVIRAMEGIRWENDAYSAEAGEVRIVLENTSSIPHNLALIDSDNTELPNTLETPSRSDTDEATLSLEPGVYALICKIPGHSNMNATLTVG